MEFQLMIQTRRYYFAWKLCDKDDIDFNNIFDLTSDNVAKALIVNPEMISEEYIKSNIIMSINKKSEKLI